MIFRKSLLYFCFIILVKIFRCEDSEVSEELDHHLLYPNYVPLVPVRHDSHSGEFVSRGRLELLGGLDPLHEDDRVSLDEFRRILQCAPSEPGLDGNRGSVGFIKMRPVKRVTIELMATWAETACDNWPTCNQELTKFRNKEEGRGQGKLMRLCDTPFHIKLLRVTNGSLFLDWPFDSSRFEEPPETRLFHSVLVSYMAPKGFILISLALSVCSTLRP